MGNRPPTFFKAKNHRRYKAMLINLSLDSRDYILKSERDGYWEKAIADANKELEQLKLDNPSSDEVKEKVADIKELERLMPLALAKLKKYGPTIWKIKSVDKETLIKQTSGVKLSLGKASVKGMKDDVSSGAIHFSQLNSVAACKSGIAGWENLKDAKTGKDIPYKRDLIGKFPIAIIYELSSVINGEVDEDDEGNSEAPLASSSG
jgi:hypothetical protein